VPAAALTPPNPLPMSRWSLRNWIPAALRSGAQHPSLRAASGFASFTLLVKAVSFLKEAVVASVFGVGATMDSYFMALAVIGFPSAVLLNAAQIVLVRDYVRTETLEAGSAASGYLRMATLAMLAAVTLVLLAWLAALPQVLALVGHGLSDEQRAHVVHNVYLLIPYYYLNNLNVLGYGVLQARKAFTRAALIPVVTPAVMLTLLAAAGAGVGVLIALMTLGTATETLLIGVTLARAPRSTTTLPDGLRRSMRGFLRGTLVLIPGTLISALAPLIEQTIASGLGRGAISALGYAAKLPQTLNSLLVTSVSVTIYPYFAERLSRGDDAGARRFFIRYAVLMLCAGLVIALVATAASGPFVRIAFQHGSFSPQSAAVVTLLQQAYLWQLPGALAAIVAIRFAAAQGRYQVLTFGNLLMVPLTGLLQWRLSGVWGPAGLALGFSLGQAMSALLFTWLALRASGEAR
jgi:putative peptidoglycan lipid II flippase